MVRAAYLPRHDKFINLASRGMIITMLTIMLMIMMIIIIMMWGVGNNTTELKRKSEDHRCGHTH